jgi:CRP-like cAMP-binding protein
VATVKTTKASHFITIDRLNFQ